MTLRAREKRLLAYLAILLAIAVWYMTPRWLWSGTVVEETEHYVIESTATPEQTTEIGRVAEIVYTGYARLEREIRPHPKLKMKLYKDREEFRRCNQIRGWAEAFYRRPFCHQYYSADELHPYHWMMHEATHQLNVEAAGMNLRQWLDEGLACYISTSRIIDGALVLGQIDTNTYPVWWLETIAASGALEADKRNGTVIPLRSIISGENGPDIDQHFNLYYLHWWSLVHFLIKYEDGTHLADLRRLFVEGDSLMIFEQNLGPIEIIERQWYDHLLTLKRDLISRTTPSVRRTLEEASEADNDQR